MDCNGKVAIVTGGASGIGRAIVVRFAEGGANVVVADINEKGGIELLEELKAINSNLKHLFVNTDVTNKESVDKLIGSTLTEFGHLDILVNNAGINIPRLLVDPAGQEELTEQIWDKVVMVNQKSAFLCAQAAARQMIKQGKGGAIINLASESGLEGSEGQSVYAATKAAMYSLTRSWAKELGKHNIRVVGVAPGILEATALRTPEYERALAYTRGITVEKLRSSYESVSIPLKRVGTLAEVGEVVCFLASDAASYVSGTVLNVSGGKSRA
jgi:sorbitol-6-phosphate 2-dehydrogenase